jgi:Protein of unknown function (DUF2798)
MSQLPRRGQFLFIFLMALMMSCAMSFAMTFIRLGFSSLLLHEWLKAWAIGFAVALPTAMVVLPFVRRVVERLTR